MDNAMSYVLAQERTAVAALPRGHFETLTKDPPPVAKRGSKENVITYDEDWLAQLPAGSGDAQFYCLTEALYFEARGETVEGQAAVAEVVLNRVEDPAFPNTICGVVRQTSARGCQFSYYCDGRSDRMVDVEAKQRAEKIAMAFINGAERIQTAGATYFHTHAVRPSWSRSFEKTIQIGAHVFYRNPVRTAAS